MTIKGSTNVTIHEKIPAENNMPDHSPDKPEPKRNRLVREITNHKLQIKGSPSGK
jgi:hypothetical protein